MSGTSSGRTPTPEEAVAEAAATRSLPDFVADAARRFGEREALVWGDVRWSYAELARQAAGVAEGLRKLGVGAGDRVGVLLPNRPEFFATVVGITSLGAVAVSLNTMATESELAFYLRHAAVERLVYTPRFLKHDYDAMLSGIASGQGAGGGGPVPIRDRVAVLREGLSLPEGARDWRDVVQPHAGGADRLAAIAAEQDGLRDARAVMFFTSGSTAKPKGVLHAHRALVHQAFVASAAFGLDATDASWGCLPMFFAGGFVIIALVTLARGGKVVLQDHFEAGRALDLMERECITFYAGWQLAPALCEHESFPRRQLSLRKGIWTNVAAAEKLLAPDHVTVGAYGLSETATLVCAGRWTDPADLRQRGFGRPLPGVEMRVVDPENQQPCAPGDVGELLVRGPSLMLGYLGIPASESFDAEGFFRTGDYGRLDETGTLRFDGRLKEVIKTAGVNVAAAEVEACIEGIAEVAAAYVVPVPHAVRGENVGAFVVPRAGATLDVGAILEHCRQEMASYKVPRHLFALAAADVPRTGTQKVDKPRLRKVAAENAGGADDLAAAASPDGATR